MSVQIGINPITWSNDDLPELGGETPLETCLRETRQAGYAGIELGNKFPRESAVLRPILARHGLALISGWYSGRLLERSAGEEIRAVEGHLRLLSDMGCSVMVFAETTGSVAGERGTPVTRRPRLLEAQWPIFAERLTAVADHLANRGVRMAYHHHMGTVVETEAEIDRLISSTGESVGLLLDTGHLAFAGADPAAVAKRHVARINHVHCKDVRPDVLAAMRKERRSFLDSVVEGVFTVPGDGAVDFAAVLDILKASHYRGWLVVEAEQDPARAHPLAYARMGYDHLSRAAERAGL
ncbi:MAG: myo-inosose-2 dehydratase [Stellaceae bacterium]